MKTSEILLLALLCCAPVTAQPFVCYANAGVPPIARVEGLTEGAGDVVLNCSGGTATPAGQPIPIADIRITLNTAITSRLVEPHRNGSEALLLIDEPVGSAQLPCSIAASPCAMTGTGTGQSYTGAPGRYNVFQGVQTASNEVTFPSVPLDQTQTHRVLRITNIRANASGITIPPGVEAAQILATISMSGPGAAPIANSTGLIVAFVHLGVVAQWRSADNNSVRSAPVPVAQDAALLTPLGTIRYGEGFATAFKIRGEEDQDIPGAIYNTESMFRNASFPIAGGLAVAGIADFGTRLRAVFTNVPAGITLWASTIPVDFTQGVPIPRAPGHTSYAAMTASAAGPFTPLAPVLTSPLPVAPLAAAGPGVFAAIWEIRASVPLAIENLDFPVYYTASSPALGTAALSAGFVPLSSEATAQPDTAKIPRFTDTAAPVNAFTVTTAPPVTITTPSLRDAAVGTPYSQTLQVSGGTAPYRWQIMSGSLPAGFVLANNGVLAGMAVAPGVNSFTAVVFDSSGAAATKPFALATVGTFGLSGFAPVSVAPYYGTSGAQTFSAVYLLRPAWGQRYRDRPHTHQQRARGRRMLRRIRR